MAHSFESLLGNNLILTIIGIWQLTAAKNKAPLIKESLTNF